MFGARGEILADRLARIIAEVALEKLGTTIACELAVAPILYQRQEKCAFVREMMVERAHANVRCKRNVVHRSGLVAAAREERPRGLQQPLSGDHPARLRAPAYGRGDFHCRGRHTAGLGLSEPECKLELIAEITGK